MKLLTASVPRTTIHILMLMTSLSALAQTKSVKHQDQYWIGYMTTTTLSHKYGWWNDAHLVPGGFGIVRTGLMRYLGPAHFTVGYAFLWLPTTPNNTKLSRHEQRPWAQLMMTLPIAPQYTLTQRIRYEARYRENVVAGEVVDGYTFNNRLRFFTAIRKNFGNGQQAWVPFVTVNDEVLINLGSRVVSNTFDQNRVAVAFGLQHGRIQYQLGYMNRFVQTGVGQYTANHTLTWMVTQKFDASHWFRKKEVTSQP